jgi:hypothetical protein
MPGTNCTAVYTVLADGVRRLSTGTEEGGSVFTVPDAPMERYYMPHDVITRTSGGTSCSGSPATPPGDTITVYVSCRTVREMWLSFDMAHAECIAPSIRALGK